MHTQSDFYRDILNNLSDGAMALDFEGKITLFNPAAARIFDVRAEDVTGRKFAEVFMMDIEGSDDFNQAVLDAVAERELDQERVVDVPGGQGDSLVLKVKSSLLRDESGEKKGVVVVFTDISNEMRMQEEQKRLNQDLTKAYSELEETNFSLRSALKKVRAIRIIVFILVVFLFSGLGLYTWKKADLSAQFEAADTQKTSDKGFKTVPVTVRPVTSKISLSGKLEPLEKVNVLCPFEGRIEEKMVQFGQRVDKGDTLLLLNSEKLRQDLRQAHTNLIEAKEAYEKLVNWEKGTEYAKAKRQLSQAEHKFGRAKSKLEESRILHENGIISDNQLQSAKDELRNSKMSRTDARENMQAIKDKANKDKLKVAEFKLQNAQEKFDRLKAKLELSRVKAPVSGVVLHPLEDKDKDYSLEKGSSFKEGGILVTVGNMQGLSVSAEVDEVDVQKIKSGQKVQVQGEGFSEVTFEGVIDQVSTMAEVSKRSDLTSFPVRVVIPDLSSKDREKIRLGMTANMQAEVYSNPKALLVPIDAVSSSSQGHFVRVPGEKEGEVQRVEVEPGITTMSMVEIKQGLEPDDEVIVP
ncbi:MAG: PAS domain S-box protein [Desulfonatronovibrionaceae bacterium]